MTRVVTRRLALPALSSSLSETFLRRRTASSSLLVGNQGPLRNIITMAQPLASPSSSYFLSSVARNNFLSEIDVINKYSSNNDNKLSYHSRAHPQPTPVVSIPIALHDLLNDAKRRNRRRMRKWKQHQQKILKSQNQSPQPKKGRTQGETTTQTTATTKTTATEEKNDNSTETATTTGTIASAADNSSSSSSTKKISPTINLLDETIELVLNLNLDPRKPGQALRGSLELPHGTGKKQQAIIVFTNQPALKQAALEAGAAYAGGVDDSDTLLDDLVQGKIPLTNIQRAVATSKDVLPMLTKTPGLARLLGPRGLMPNPKDGTVMDQSTVSPQDVKEMVESQMAGKEVMYKTEKEGILHIPVGKASFGMDKLLDNIGVLLKEVFRIKPEQYGKGKKKPSSGKGTRYLLKASVSSTQGKGVALDLRTLDPTSPFFLTYTVEETRARTTVRKDADESKEDQEQQQVA